MSAVERAVRRLVCAQLRAKRAEFEARARGEENETKKLIYETYVDVISELEKDMGCEEWQA